MDGNHRDGSGTGTMRATIRPGCQFFCAAWIAAFTPTVAAQFAVLPFEPDEQNGLGPCTPVVGRSSAQVCGVTHPVRAVHARSIRAAMERMSTSNVGGDDILRPAGQRRL